MKIRGDSIKYVWGKKQTKKRFMNVEKLKELYIHICIYKDKRKNIKDLGEQKN